GAIKTEIEKAVRRLLHGLEHPQQIDLAQLAYSQHRDEQRSRPANSSRPCRLSIVATSVSDLKQKLTWVLDHLSEQSEKRSDEIRYPQGVYYRESSADVGRVCFLFPGQGSQKVNMLRDLIVAQPQLHGLFERADNLLADELGQPLSRHIYPLPVFTDGEREAQQQTLNATDIAQPALGVTDLAAFELLKRFGLRPDFVAGHSYGEYVALCAAGAISANDLIRLSRNRGRIAARAGKTTPGAMAAVDANHTQVADMITQHGLKASIANVNAPDQTILAGPIDAIDAAISVLSNESVRVRRIPVSAAFHCAIMNNAREELAAALADTPFNAPTIPVFSNTTGKRYPENADEMRGLLARHIAEPVQFVDEINALYEAGARVFVECGPGLILSGLTDRILSGKPHATLSLDAPGRPGWLQLAHLLAQAQTLGLPVNIETWFAKRGLKNQSLEDLFSRVRERANPGPLVWRVNGGRAAPWHSAPRNIRIPTVGDNGIKKAPSTGGQPDMLAMPNIPTPNAISALAKSNAAARPNVRTQPSAPTPPTFIGNRRNTMLKDDPDMSNAALPLANSFSESQFTQVQHSINQFIELQQEQQRTWRRFLDFQAHLIGAEPQRIAAASRQSGSPMAYADRETTMANNHGMLGAVAPAPVLPKRLMAVSAEPMRAHIIPTPPAAANDHLAEPPPRSEKGNGKTVGTFAPPAQFKTDLLRAVSERTGYPEDMLALDAHMEADLGIDSIKRIEIFSGLKDQYNLFEGRNEEAVLEQLSGFKTLNEIIAWYEGLSALTEDDNGRDSSPKKALTPPSFSLIETVESRTTQTAAPTISAPAPSSFKGQAGKGLESTGRVVSSNTSIQSLADIHPLPNPGPSLRSPLKGDGLEAVLDRSADGTDTPRDATPSDPVQCYAVRPIAADLETHLEPTDIPTRYPILIVGEITPLNTAFLNMLKSSGHEIRQLIPGAETRALGENRFEVDLSSAESVSRVREQFLGAEPVGVIINLMGASAGRDVANKHQNDARALFLILKAFEHDLKASAQEGAGLLLNITSFDGQFGLSRSRTFPVGAAGTLGVAKSAAREWPHMRVKCIDVAPALEAEWVADQVLTEIRSQDASIETGYTSEGRWRLELKPNGVAENHLGKLALDAGAVMLVTGGAYGITADITRALAEKGRLHLVLVGRSAMPEEEPIDTRDINDPAQLKQHLIKTLRSQRERVTPAEIDKTYKRVIKDRCIRANLAAMRATGADVEYHCLDVRDATAFEALIDDVYARHGRIDGVLHGAGVISDKLIGDKSLASFDEVFDTKVTPALALANKLRPNSLKFLVFFSSVAGRFGNAGQSDYSAANEVLNKLADRLSHAWPTVHTLSINWGPWDAGMVSDELRKLYASKSIRPIPIEIGKRHCLEELARGATGEPEIVISSSIKQIAALRAGRQSA
ncbi:MAG TPA: SDR family NAD(P)-dependent oxidoreductase, partial [Burkholderiales bacterium]|nr:SDR family NAD(P)-dependent oxidoreductase [Burkholderiales bacterium]